MSASWDFWKLACLGLVYLGAGISGAGMSWNWDVWEVVCPRAGMFGS